VEEDPSNDRREDRMTWYADKIDAEDVSDEFFGETPEKAALKFFDVNPGESRVMAYLFDDSGFAEEIELKMTKLGVQRVELYQDGEFLAELGDLALKFGYPIHPDGVDRADYIYPKVGPLQARPYVNRSYAIRVNPKKE